MPAPAASPRALKRALKEVDARERLASTWLIRLGLFLALAAWAYDEYYASGQPRGRSKARAEAARSAGKQLMLYIGGAVAVGKLALRWYFVRERRELDEQLLSEDPEMEQEVRPKYSKKGKRR